MYELIFDEEVINELNKFSKELRERIFSKIINTKENPFHFFERLSERKEYKLRVGDYRIIAEIDQSAKKVLVIFIGHRKNVYKKI